MRAARDRENDTCNHPGDESTRPKQQGDPERTSPPDRGRVDDQRNRTEREADERPPAPVNAPSPRSPRRR
jgi:hypothetical protein